MRVRVQYEGKGTRGRKQATFDKIFGYDTPGTVYKRCTKLDVSMDTIYNGNYHAVSDGSDGSDIRAVHENYGITC